MRRFLFFVTQRYRLGGHKRWSDLQAALNVSVLEVRARAALRLTSLLFAGVLLTFVSCGTPAGPRDGLNGNWAWEYNRNPSGSSMNLSLRTAGSDVTGTGVSYGIGPANKVDSITVVGHRAVVLVESFVLTLDFASGRVVTYSGQLVGASQLKGTWTEANQSHSAGFYRE
jgi:hypothetical protein